MNSFGAERRRVSHFYDDNHTQGVFTPKEVSKGIHRYIFERTGENIIFTPKIIEPDPEYPNTFDLRKYTLKNN